MSAVETNIETSFSVIKEILEDPSGFSLTKLKGVAEDIDLKDKKSLIDVAIRARMLRLLACDSLDDVKTLLKNGVAAALANLCSPPTPFILFADVFNTKPISVCDELFDFMEETIITLKDMPLFSSGRNTLLRMCNDLLKRLSKSQDTVFCGRIQLFLTRLFPLDEKSGLNFMSNFNTEKDVVYNKNPDPSVFKSQHLNDTAADDLEEGEMTEQSVPLTVDASLYVKFWSLQEFFKSPVLCYEKSKWQRFTGSTDNVLDVFSSIKLMNNDVNDVHSQCDARKFSKYLTSEKLLDLQLMDPSFRRYILVQFLILFQYLTTPTKFKTTDQVLNDEQQNWVENKRRIILQLMSSDSTSSPANKGSFVSTVESILERETHWNRWKNDGCPSFIRVVEKCPFSPRKRRINPLVNRAGQKIYRFSNRTLDKLWNTCPDNLTACRDQRRIFNPDLNTYFQDAVVELDPAEKVEEEYKSINKEEWSWRALRLLARRCPHFYISWNPPGRRVKDYLGTLLTEKMHLDDERKNCMNVELTNGIDETSRSDIPFSDVSAPKQPRLDSSIESANLDADDCQTVNKSRHKQTNGTGVSAQQSVHKRQANNENSTKSRCRGAISSDNDLEPTSDVDGADGDVDDDDNDDVDV